MRAHMVLPIVTLLVAVGIIVASGGVGGGQPVEAVIDIHYSRFEPATVRVPVGRPVTFVLRNGDPIDHEWIAGDEALHERHRTGTEPYHRERPTERTVPALTEVRTTVTFETPGTMRFVCHLPGHEAYGMIGSITVAP